MAPWEATRDKLKHQPRMLFRASHLGPLHRSHSRLDKMELHPAIHSHIPPWPSIVKAERIIGKRTCLMIMTYTVWTLWKKVLEVLGKFRISKVLVLNKLLMN